jgi:predicted GIY-YIG superfamily endonuclease
MPHFVYILRCSDRSFYVGHTSDIAERLDGHNSGRGPTYTVAGLPVELVYFEQLSSMEAAVQREAQLKRWTRAKKEAPLAADTSRRLAVSATALRSPD